MKQKLIVASSGRKKFNDEKNIAGQVLKNNSMNSINLRPGNHLLGFKKQMRAVSNETMQKKTTQEQQQQQARLKIRLYIFQKRQDQNQKQLQLTPTTNSIPLFRISILL